MSFASYHSKGGFKPLRHDKAKLVQGKKKDFVAKQR